MEKLIAELERKRSWQMGELYKCGVCEGEYSELDVLRITCKECKEITCIYCCDSLDLCDRCADRKMFNDKI